MKANELMVGDFVLLNGKPIKVSAVHNRKIGYHVSKTKMVFVFENAIQPIWITQELLEKNGFNLITLGQKQYFRWSGAIFLCVSPHFFELFIDSISRKSKSYIMYLHELQHAFNWCDIKEDWQV